MLPKESQDHLTTVVSRTTLYTLNTHKCKIQMCTCTFSPRVIFKFRCLINFNFSAYVLILRHSRFTNYFRVMTTINHLLPYLLIDLHRTEGTKMKPHNVTRPGQWTKTRWVTGEIAHCIDLNL